MRKIISSAVALFFVVILLLVIDFSGVSSKNLFSPPSSNPRSSGASNVLASKKTKSFWFILHRASNKEFLYFGEPGERGKSTLVREFNVRVGVPGKKPTPVPALVGREYWVITEKRESFENPETAPYFLKLDIEAPPEYPFGPAPYLECNGQCSWEKPGDFGLHGVNEDLSKLSSENEGSSGCIRHTDEDITFLYNTLDPTKDEIRYYVRDI